MEETSQEHKCVTCKAIFSTIDKVKEHYRGDWHVLNSKRRANGLAPVSKAEFKQAKPVKATKSSVTHLQSKPILQPSIEFEDTAASEAEFEELPVSPTISIFDTQEFSTVDECIEYMVKTFGFFLPDVEYVIDLEGMLQFLGEKVKCGGCCLYCQKQFRSARACQSHMIDKSHCKIAYEEDVDLDEFEDFYDFTSSYDDEPEGEDGELVGKTVSISHLGELVLLDGRTVGHRDYRVYYKQNHRPEDNRPAIVAHRREQLLQMEASFGGRKTTSEELATMSDSDVRTLLVKYHKQWRKGQIVEQRAMLKRHMRDQKREVKSLVDKARSSVTTTAIIRDYHKTVM